MLRRTLGSTIALLAATLALAGCAEQQPVINRVEAYALPKTLFAGEWYFHRTVIDTPGTYSVAFVGETNFQNQYRIRWDIQENYLYARTTAEFIKGAKPEVNQNTGEYKGEIVGAWRILSHFDLKKGYNPTTGEETNVLTENPMDCVWYNCKYVRVDWSTNHAIDVAFLHFNWDFFNTIKHDPVPFYVQDYSDPKYKPIFDQEAGYIDITNAVAIHPQDVYYSYYDMYLPFCWLRDGVSCNTEIINVRNSFWRRDPNRDYEPRLHRGDKDEWFGYFVQQRWHWYSEQGMTYKAKKHYLNRHNIWAASHEPTGACTDDKQCSQFGAGSVCDKEIAFHKFDVEKDSDADGLPDAYEDTVEGLHSDSADSDGDGLTDAKDDANGNNIREIEDYWQWDADNMEHRCTIPLNKRVPKPLVYFASGDWPKSLVCDEHASKTAMDNDPNPCQPWAWSADPKVREDKWASMHYASVNYEEAFWKVYLQGGYGWSYDDYKKWITTKDINQFNAEQQNTLKQFGDNDRGYYSFAICPNNPVTPQDPWPCRFPRHSFAQAKELMDAGLTFNHLSYKQARALLDAGKTVDQTPPVIRLGDVRYCTVQWVKDYAPSAPLGFGPSYVDDHTGETVSGMANIYSGVDTYNTRLHDMVKLLNGEMDTTEYVNGVDIRQWLDKVQSGLAPDGSYQATIGLHSRAVAPGELAEMYNAMEQPWMQKVPKQGSSKQFANMYDSEGNLLNSIQLRHKLMDTMTKSGLFDKTKVQVDLSAVKGSQLERRLMDDEVLMAAGYDPGDVTSVTESVLDKASVARNLFTIMEAREHYRAALRDEHAIDFADEFLAAVDEGLSGVAARLKQFKPEDRWAKIRTIQMRPLVIHEMGHSLGLHHNFGGSEDVMNFHPEYWNLRTENGTQTKACPASPAQPGQLCPFYIRPMSTRQLVGEPGKGLMGLTEYAYTSVMEYDKHSTMMGLGLGRYDVAAFLYGYTDKVEVFKDPGQVPLSPDNIFEQWHAGDGTVMLLGTDAPKSFHYTQWYTLMGNKLFDEHNRQLVDHKQMQKVRDPQGRNQGWFYVNGNQKMVRVPYIFCSPYRSNISGRCMTWDWGADYYERMKMHVDDWDTWYVIAAFPRGRVNYSKRSYQGRRYRYFYQRLKDFNNTYALYQGLFHQWYDQAAINKFFTDPLNGWGDYTVAMHDAFNVAMRTLSMPDIKPFKDKNPQPDGQTIYTEADFGTYFRTGLANGRYFATSYYNTDFEQPGCGQYWWECLHHIGFYMDKVMAMMVLADPETYFVGQDTAEDLRTYRISFFDNFSTQIVDFFGAMLSEDYDAICPWFDPSKPREDDESKPAKIVTDGNQVTWVNGVAQRNYANPGKDPKKPASGAAVEAATRFTLQLYGAVLGMFLFQDNFDNQYVERARVWKEGKGTTWEVKTGGNVAGTSRYTNPFTGVTYVGIDYIDNKGIAERAIAHANALKAHSNYCSTTPGDPDECVPSNDQPGAAAALKQYNDLLDVIVQTTTMYDAWVGNWSGSPYYP